MRSQTPHAMFLKGNKQARFCKLLIKIQNLKIAFDVRPLLDLAHHDRQWTLSSVISSILVDYQNLSWISTLDTSPVSPVYVWMSNLWSAKSPLHNASSAKVIKRTLCYCKSAFPYYFLILCGIAKHS